MRLDEIQIARLIDHARASVEEEKFLEAVQLYQRLILQEPSLPTPYLELSSLYAERNQVDAAIRLLRNGIRALPGHPDIILHLGGMYLRHGEYDAAVTCLKTLADRKLPQVHYSMAVAYFYKDDIKRAEEEFRLTLKLDPVFPKINESLGELLLDRGALTEAIEHLKRGIAIDPYCAMTHALLGTAYGRLLEWKKALAEFVLAVDMDPGEASHWRMCGESLMKLKRLPEAERYLRKALELQPRSVDALADLGDVLSLRGQYEDAMQCVERALGVDPTNEHAKRVRWNLGARSRTRPAR